MQANCIAALHCRRPPRSVDIWVRSHKARLAQTSRGWAVNAAPLTASPPPFPFSPGIHLPTTYPPGPSLVPRLRADSSWLVRRRVCPDIITPSRGGHMQAGCELLAAGGGGGGGGGGWIRSVLYYLLTAQPFVLFNLHHICGYK